MLRYKSHKQALIMTALVILLCLVSLSGATLALFTSNPQDGTIGIVATTGSVKVDITDASTGESLVDKCLQFSEEEVLFEPGAAFYTQGFKVQNEGTIPINFSFSISRDEGVNMEDFDKAFDVWISTDPTDPDSVISLTDFRGRLEAGQNSADTYYLSIRMKETADNTFQGYYTGIGVTVYAVQGNVQI